MAHRASGALPQSHGDTQNPPPPVVPGDEVIPFRYFDDKWVNRALLINFTYRIDAVLDASILRSSLERLMQLDGWRKLGARVRQNESGQLEYHVPERYDEQRPCLLFHQENHTGSISEHGLASQLPRARDVPTIFPTDTKIFHPLAHPDHPQKIEDWITTDKPPLSLSVRSFTDATLVTLSFSHTLLDAVGRQCLFKAWSALINGREEDVPPFVGYREDPLDAISGEVPAEKHVLYDQQITDFGANRASGLSEKISEKVGRVACLPNTYVQRLKKQARQDLGESAPFLSEGDVLFAFWSKLMVQALELPPTQKLALMNVYNFSGLIDEVVPPNSAFIGNLAASIFTSATVGQLISQPLGVTALQLRKELLRQRSPEQVRALVSLHKESMKKLGRPPIFGSPDQMYMSWSNWHRARFFDFDFSGAVVDRKEGEKTVPSLICLTGHENALQVINGGSLMGRDKEGNWWIHWSMYGHAWGFVEDAIKEMARST